MNVSVEVSFVFGKLPFNHNPADLQIRFSPHQGSLFTAADDANFSSLGCEVHYKKCICKQSNPQPIYQNLPIQNIGGSLLWIDPTNIPSTCLASIVSNWAETVKPTDNLGLGFVIPSDESIQESGKSQLWRASLKGAVKTKVENLPALVWYPSIARNPKTLLNIAEELKPLEVFALAEFPPSFQQQFEEDWTRHSDLLDQYRARTENLIYIDNEQPKSAFDTLTMSIAAVRKSSKFQTAVLTPGGRPVCYLLTIIAGALNGAAFAVPIDEIPISHSNIVGYVILKARI